MPHPVRAYWRRWFQVGPCFVDEMEAGRYGSLGDIGSGNRFRPHSGAPASGLGGTGEWLVGCWSLHFPGWAQGRTAKTRVKLVQIIIAFSIVNTYMTPFRYYYKQHYGLGKGILNTYIILLQYHYNAWKKTASEAYPLLIRRVLP